MIHPLVFTPPSRFLPIKGASLHQSNPTTRMTDMIYEKPPYSTLETLGDDLSQRGYAIIPSVIPNGPELEALRSRARLDFCSLTRGKVDISEPSTHKSWRTFMVMHSMLLQHSGVGNMPWLWDIRQRRRVAEPFARIWGVEVEDLLVSSDGASLHLPPENTGNCGWYKGNDWLHTDQRALEPDFKCVQGWVNLFDTNEGDATLCVYEGSHELHREFFEAKAMQGDIFDEKSDWYKIDRKSEWETNFFEELHGCRKIGLIATAGDLVLWDSRTFHMGTEPRKGRAKPNTRLVAYVCYTPRKLASLRDLERKRDIFLKGRTTSHWPHKPKVFGVRPRTYGNPMPEVDPVPPFPRDQLTALGERLAGF